MTAPNDHDANPKHDRLRTDTLTSSVILLLGFTVVQRTIGLGRGVLFCRWMTPEALGEWEMVFSFLMLAAPLAVLGIPGSYGRYLEYYRKRGHLRTFLSRTFLWTVGCTVTVVVAISLAAKPFSRMLFGTPDQAMMVVGLAAVLAALIFHHTLTSLLAALRLFRVVSVMNFIQSGMFAAVGLGLLLAVPAASSVLAAYGIGCVAASVCALCYVWPGLAQTPKATDHLPTTAFWSRLFRFAFFVWLMNVLAHLFGVVDRYMLLHWSGMEPEVALEQIGHYHSSRIIPLLMISFCDLLGGTMIPHFAHDWEMGRRSSVSRSLKLAVKVTAIGMIAFAAAVIAFAPVLFNQILGGKYSAGLAVLPWTLSACLWYGLFTLLESYLFCAERTKLAATPLAGGLILNISLNLVLVPVLGLQGAVIATAVSTGVCVAALLLLSAKHGFTLDRGLLLACSLPAFVAFGANGLLIAAVVLTAAAIIPGTLFDRYERLTIHRVVGQAASRVRARLRRHTIAAEPAGLHT
ncbi:MAG: lipopolysaccharide biosynthesis protein [Planctomycetota bacterium]